MNCSTTATMISNITGQYSCNQYTKHYTHSRLPSQPFSIAVPTFAAFIPTSQSIPTILNHHPNHSQSPSQPCSISHSNICSIHSQPRNHSQPFSIRHSQSFPTSHSHHSNTCSRSVTIRVLCEAFFTWSTPKLHTAASVDVVILDTKKRMAKLSTVYPIHPSVHMLRELRRPPCTSDVDGALMVEV